MSKPLDPSWDYEVDPDTGVSMFIQWKGTDVCMDFRCPCGHWGHIHGDFAYFYRCICGKVYELGYQVRTREVSEQDLVDSRVPEGMVYSDYEGQDKWEKMDE